MKVLFAFLLLFINLSSFACSGCNVSTGLVNNDPVDYFSFKYRNTVFDGVESSFFRHSGHGGSFAEKYANYDFGVKYFFYKNWYAQSVFSYQNLKLESDSSNNSVSGLVDPYLFIGYNNYSLFENWQLNYNIFGGLDFGIGKYDRSFGEEYSAGSKSYDGIVGVELLAKLKRVGFSVKSNLKMNLENSEDYHFGNGFNTSFLFLYYLEKENLTYIPYLGSTYELNLEDKLDKDLVLNTSSEVLFFDIGINFLIKEKVLFGGKYQIGFLDNIPGWESVSVSGFEIELSYIFGS